MRRDELAAFAGQTIPDLAGHRVRLLFVGINPGLWSAATRAHFARPGNRFYPALFAAGITPWLVDPRDGYAPDDLQMMRERGIGITNIVARASARADELSTDELRRGAELLVGRIGQIAPRVVAFLGVTSYRQAFAAPKTTLGKQPGSLGGAPYWVLPNPSGLNAHETVASLAAAYAEPAREAGILA